MKEVSVFTVARIDGTSIIQLGSFTNWEDAAEFKGACIEDLGEDSDAEILVLGETIRVY